MGVALGKLYAAVLNNRLSNWVEKMQYRAKAQAGFRKDYRCADNLFILRSIREKCASQHTKLYCCFVDFSKAFDTIPRAQLWKVLDDLGIYGNMLQAIKSIYATVQARVKTPEGYTDTLDSEMGVLQGCILSPLLFGLFLDPLEKLLIKCNANPPMVLGHPLPAQFFADDSQLLSTTPEGLQTLINALQRFCDENGLTVNVGKTKIMIFGGKSEFSWTYNNSPIEVVESYRNLGLDVTPIGKFSNGCASALTISAKKQQHGLFSKSTVTHINQPARMLGMFDSLVRSNLCYGAEVWGVDYGVQVRQYQEPGAGTAAKPVKPDEHEALHKYFIKRVLGVCTSTPDLVIYGEVARLPLAYFRLQLIVNYWNRLCKMPDDRLLKMSFLESWKLASHNKTSWCKSFKAMVEPLGIIFAEHPQPIEGDFVDKMRKTFIQNYERTLSQATETSSLKLYTYNLMRSEKFVLQPYLRARSRDLRKRMAQFRSGSHWLEIQQGRFLGMARNDRICKKCQLGATENEEHVVFECPLYAPLRQKHKKLFEQAQDLSSVCQSPLAARFIYECYLMHAEFVAEV